MASKNSKNKASKRRAGAGAKKPKLLRTKFMADFTKQFIRKDGTRIWPKTGQLRPAIVADFQVFANVLFTIGYGQPPPVGSGPLGDQIIAFCAANQWPNNPASVSRALQEKWGLGTIALVDIAVILDRLLAEVNGLQIVKKAPGGGPGGWPPH
jgi:hypothetical protein